MARTTLLLLVLVGCAAKVADEEVTAVLDLEGDLQAGREVYGDHCEHCHDADGLGIKAKPLPEHVPAQDDYDLALTILRGPFWMPNFKKKLEPQQVRDVMEHLRDEFGEYDPAVAHEH